MSNLQSAPGVAVILDFAWLLSGQHRTVALAAVRSGLAATFTLALVLLKVPQLKLAFVCINDAVEAIAAATRAGTSFGFGHSGGGHRRSIRKSRRGRRQ